MLARLTAATPTLSGAREPMFLDLDDTVRATYGYAEQGAGRGYSGVNGLNALLGTLSTVGSAPVIAGNAAAARCLGTEWAVSGPGRGDGGGSGFGDGHRERSGRTRAGHVRAGRPAEAVIDYYATIPTDLQQGRDWHTRLPPQYRGRVQPFLGSDARGECHL